MNGPLTTEPGRLRVLVADRPASRAVGLLPRTRLHPRAGLWFARCAAVHTVGMRMAIDVVFVDRASRILRIVPHLGPGRLACCPGADAVIELHAGAAGDRGWVTGDRIVAGTLRRSGRRGRQWRPLVHEPHRRS